MSRSLRLTASLAAMGLCLAVAGCSAPKFKTDYDIAVTLTPAAVAKLKAADETVIVDGYYFGAPADATRDKANEDGQIELGQDLTTIQPQSQTVHIAGNGLDQDNLDKVVGRKVNVTLRAYSGTDQANMLNCTSVTLPLSDIQAKAPAISCDAA